MSDQKNDTAQAEVEQKSGDKQVNMTSAEQADTVSATPEAEANNEQQANEQQVVDIDAMRSELEKEKDKARANLDIALRAQAEMENLRKRTTRDVENARKYALEKFVNELLPIIDSLEFGLIATDNVSNNDNDELKEGMELVLKMFLTALEKFAVRQISPEGEVFNPELHEAVSMQDIDGKKSGTIVSVTRKGYELNGRLIRPAMVMVAK